MAMCNPSLLSPAPLEELYNIVGTVLASLQLELKALLLHLHVAGRWVPP
jgi:hypothetical protein